MPLFGHSRPQLEPFSWARRLDFDRRLMPAGEARLDDAKASTGSSAAGWLVRCSAVQSTECLSRWLPKWPQE
jgi:hypothetical protein